MRAGRLSGGLCCAFCPVQADRNVWPPVSFRSAWLSDRVCRLPETRPLPHPFARYALIALCLLAAADSAVADRKGGRDRGKHDDQERAWQARRSGEILPLETILNSVLRAYPGELLKIEFDDDDGELIYEMKILTRRGIVLEMEIDARTGRILEIEEDD